MFTTTTTTITNPPKQCIHQGSQNKAQHHPRYPVKTQQQQPATTTTCEKNNNKHKNNVRMVQAAGQVGDDGIAKLCVGKVGAAKPIHEKVLRKHALVVESKQRREDLLAGKVSRGPHHHDAERALGPVFRLQAVGLHV